MGNPGTKIQTGSQARLHTGSIFHVIKSPSRQERAMLIPLVDQPFPKMVYHLAKG